MDRKEQIFMQLSDLRFRFYQLMCRPEERTVYLVVILIALGGIVPFIRSFSDVRQSSLRWLYEPCIMRGALNVECYIYADDWSLALTGLRFCSILMLIITLALCITFGYQSFVHTSGGDDVFISMIVACIFGIVLLALAVIVNCMLANGFGMPEPLTMSDVGIFHWKHSRLAPDLPTILHGELPLHEAKTWYIA